MADDTQKKIAEIEARRAERQSTTAKAREEQYAKDLVHVDELEIEHGDDRVAVLKTSSFVAGLPTVVVVKTPAPSEFKRYRQMVRKAGLQKLEAVGAARDMLAAECVAYPDKETYERMKEAWPSIHDNVGGEAVRLGEAEGKD
jgi:hypothetical protein